MNHLQHYSAQIVLGALVILTGCLWFCFALIISQRQIIKKAMALNAELLEQNKRLLNALTEKDSGKGLFRP